jgi:hypothetical protein
VVTPDVVVGIPEAEELAFALQADTETAIRHAANAGKVRWNVIQPGA